MADLSVYNRDKLWAKTSKAGLEFQTLTRNKTVIFVRMSLSTHSNS